MGRNTTFFKDPSLKRLNEYSNVSEQLKQQFNELDSHGCHSSGVLGRTSLARNSRSPKDTECTQKLNVSEILRRFLIFIDFYPP